MDRLSVVPVCRGRSPKGDRKLRRFERQHDMKKTRVGLRTWRGPTTGNRTEEAFPAFGWGADQKEGTMPNKLGTNLPLRSGTDPTGRAPRGEEPITEGNLPKRGTHRLTHLGCFWQLAGIGAGQKRPARDSGPDRFGRGPREQSVRRSFGKDRLSNVTRSFMAPNYLRVGGALDPNAEHVVFTGA